MSDEREFRFRRGRRPASSRPTSGRGPAFEWVGDGAIALPIFGGRPRVIVEPKKISGTVVLTWESAAGRIVSSEPASSERSSSEGHPSFRVAGIEEQTFADSTSVTTVRWPLEDHLGRPRDVVGTLEGGVIAWTVDGQPHPGIRLVVVRDLGALVVVPQLFRGPFLGEIEERGDAIRPLYTIRWEHEK
jgi:hypothetical protein